MRQVWERVKKLLFPSWRWTLPLAAVSAAGLYLVFTRGLESVPLAYAVYLLSAYGLTAAAGLAVRAGRRVWQWVRSIPLAERWLEDEYFRVWAGLLLSFLVNLCYAGLKVVCAVLYSSFWEGALGFYYILLSAVRLYLLRHTPSSRGGSDYTRELRACRWAGVYLLVLNLAPLWISVQIVRDGQGYHYPGTLIYAAAAYSFYCLTLAVIHAVKYRALRSPALTAAKAVTLTCALVSIFSLETAMLSQFGGGADFRTWMTSATAGVVCALGLVIAVYLLVSAGRRLKQR